MFGRVQIGAAAGEIVPIIALHAAAAAGYHAARQAVAAAALVLHKAVAVAVHILIMAGLDVGAFGIGDAGIGGAGGGFAAAGELGGFGGAQRPFVVALQIGKFGSHQGGFGQAGAGVFGGVAGNIERGAHGIGNGGWGEIGGAGAAFATAHIHGEVERFVLLVFDVLDFLQPHLHGLADGFAHIGFGRGGAAGFGQLDGLGANIAQGLLAVVKHGGVPVSNENAVLYLSRC